MSKKIIFFVCIFSYTTTFTAQPISLTSQETKIYDALKDEYPAIRDPRKINAFLQTNNLSPQDLYDILHKKKDLLTKTRWELINYFNSLKKSHIENFLNYLFPPQHTVGGPAVAGAYGLAFIIATVGPLIIGVPTLMLGFALKNFMHPPSTTRKILSYGLIGTGGILSLPATVSGLTLTAIGSEKLLKNLMYFPKTKYNEKKSRQMHDDLNFTEGMLQRLREFYPEIN
ncbi:MAG TPA: hypothetical protein VKU36_03675 [Candidatus Babeliales bacterium]|nr:hypothetical protein [Candidatus Babeliales bacterium]